MIGPLLLLLVFLAIAPQSRGFIAGAFENAIGHLQHWGLFSYLLILLVVFAALISIVLIKLWPKRQEPFNPMARYRKEQLEND